MANHIQIALSGKATARGRNGFFRPWLLKAHRYLYEELLPGQEIRISVESRREPRHCEPIVFHLSLKEARELARKLRAITKGKSNA